jgi:hypothetical protein
MFCVDDFYFRRSESGPRVEIIDGKIVIKESSLVSASLTPSLIDSLVMVMDWLMEC